LRLIVYSILETFDILNDGPDKSDEEDAMSRFNKAIVAAKEYRRNKND
jgi:hypothetical protein